MSAGAVYSQPEFEVKGLYPFPLQIDCCYPYLRMGQGLTSPEKMPSDKRPSKEKSSSAKKAKYGIARSASCEDSLMNPPTAYSLRPREPRYRAISECQPERVDATSPRRFLQNWTLPTRGVKGSLSIQQLPVDCRLQIFSYLDIKERGQAAQVCQDWSRLIKTPSLWADVDLTNFSVCSRKNQSNHHCGQSCYEHYREQVQKLMRYLIDLKPVLRTLDMSFDIGDNEEDWLNYMKALVKSSRCHDLQTAHINWIETPILSGSSEQSSRTINDYIYSERRRQRLFYGLFDAFTVAAQNLRHLHMPFAWSAKAISSLRRLTQVQSLTLDKCFVFQTPSQDLMDELMLSIPSVQKLELEIWSPTARGLELYDLASATLTSLDLSRCQGFYLRSVNMPNLQKLVINRNLWIGPQSHNNPPSFECLHRLLARSSGSLQQINDHHLLAGWRETIYPELEVHLKNVCPCPVHKA